MEHSYTIVNKDIQYLSADLLVTGFFHSPCSKIGFYTSCFTAEYINVRVIFLYKLEQAMLLNNSLRKWFFSSTTSLKALAKPSAAGS